MGGAILKDFSTENSLSMAMVTFCKLGTGIPRYVLHSIAVLEAKRDSSFIFGDEIMIIVVVKNGE